jgi:hypothetical protein
MTTEQYAAWQAKAWEIFYIFMARKGWSHDEIQFEAALLARAGFNPKATERELKDMYFTAIRKGATRRLTRKERIPVILTYENACNHASIEIFEMNEVA